MKTIILAGGRGTRLGQITETIPKPMVSIGNKPIVWHIMKYYAHFGYNDFIISAGVKANVIKEYFLNFDLYNQNFTKDFSTGELFIHDKVEEIDWKISVIDTGINTLKGARIKRLEKFLDGPIHMVTYGDGLSNIDIKKLVEFHKSHGKIITISGVHPPGRFGDIKEKNSQVISFEEKPESSGGMINGGYMVFNKILLNYLTTNESCDFEFGALEALALKGEVMVYKHSDKWACVDHGRDLVHLKKLWNENKAFWKVWK
jgi:glucose-1-phosphate cytidylyltransferase